MPFIIAGLVVLLFYHLFRLSLMSTSLNENDVVKYMNQLDEFSDSSKLNMIRLMSYDTSTGITRSVVQPHAIKNEEQFHRSFAALIDVQYTWDKMRNVIEVNRCACFMVKYYGNLIFKYGNSREKAVFFNNIKLLKMNNIIRD